MMMNSFEELSCWKHARELSKYVFELCESRNFNRYEFLRHQFISSSVSIMQKIAAGSVHGNEFAFKEYLEDSRGSVFELRSLAYVLLDNRIISNNLFLKLKEKIKDLDSRITGLINYLEKSGLVKS